MTEPWKKSVLRKTTKIAVITQAETDLIPMILKEAKSYEIALRSSLAVDSSECVVNQQKVLPLAFVVDYHIPKRKTE